MNETRQWLCFVYGLVRDIAVDSGYRIRYSVLRLFDRLPSFDSSSRKEDLNPSNHDDGPGLDRAETPDNLFSHNDASLSAPEPPCPCWYCQHPGMDSR